MSALREDAALEPPDPTGGFLGMRRRPPAPAPVPAPSAPAPARPAPTPAAPAPARSLSEREKILAAIADLAARGARTTTAAIALRAWRMWPETFSLAETDGAHPDSARVAARVADLVARGLLTRTTTGTVRATGGRR